jgi:hypothetical protein
VQNRRRLLQQLVHSIFNLRPEKPRTKNDARKTIQRALARRARARKRQRAAAAPRFRQSERGADVCSPILGCREGDAT